MECVTDMISCGEECGDYLSHMAFQPPPPHPPRGGGMHVLNAFVLPIGIRL